MKEIFELDDLVREFKLEFSSFKEKGNKSAGTRARKKLSELAKYCATVRKAIQEEKEQSSTYCMIGLFFIGIPFSVLVLYVLLKAREYDRSI